MKLILIITTTILIFSNFCFSQAEKDSTIRLSEIVGVWQVKSAKVSSTLQANFQFFKGGQFKYNVSGYDDLNPIYYIAGLFKISSGTLYLKIKEIKKLDGFKIVESSPGFQFGSFALSGGKIVTILQNDSTYSEHAISVVKAVNATVKKCVTIDNEKYFKLSDNPNKYNQ